MVIIDEIKHIFSPEGALSNIEGYEFRTQQLEMALAVTNSLLSGTHYIIEAPTGVGKSFAYLIPSILFAKEYQRKAVVSTCTINLQEQLIGKDIPLLKSLLNVDFKAEILKGRQNYVCTRRLNNALIRKANLFMSEEQKQIERIYEHIQKGGGGSRQEMNFKVDENVWSEIFAEEGICTSKSCGSPETSCFYQQAKQKIKDADVVILNHYLFFTLFGFYERTSPGYLFSNDFVIFDEAHTLEDIAAENVSPKVSKETVRFWLHKLYNPRKQKGFLAKYENTYLRKLVNELLRENDDFFFKLVHHVNNIYSRKPFKEQLRILEPLKLNTDFPLRLDELTGEIKKFTSRAKTSDDENEIKNYFTKFTRIKNNIVTFLEQKLEGHVYWIEFSEGRRKNITLCISPLDMAEYFRQNVFTDNRLSIMTSATLSESGSMDYFKKSIGAEEIYSEILDSPFDFSRQMKIHIDASIPEPAKREDFEIDGLYNNDKYEALLPEKIIEYVRITNGGALLLFTNIRLLVRIYEKIKAELNALGITCLSQSDGTPRNKLLEEFKKDSNSVLMGVDSFWMGIDVPGESLRNVIITRLPFDIPDHPLVEAKIEFMKQQGKNPFYEYSLPNAILKFRQGVGRLIRNKIDEGIICILDSRIISRTYGKRFIRSVPECEVIVHKENED